MRLAIFDFDGTITKGDSLFAFIRFTHGPVKTTIGLILLSPFLFLYLIKIFPNWLTKEIVLMYCYRGWTLDRFNEFASEFAQTDLKNIVKQSAVDKINWHKQQGHTVVVVSASIENYLSEWCRIHGLDLLGTRLETKNGRLTGKIEGKNCHGQEKIRRIKEKYDLKSFELIYAYGDTKGDLTLKEIAGEFHYKKFE